MDTVTPDRQTRHGRVMFGILFMTAGALMLVERLAMVWRSIDVPPAPQRDERRQS